MQDSFITVLKAIFKRDLTKLKREINAYQDETNLWIVDKDISNSAGNLCLHLIGNLNTFIAGEIGQSGYVRQRELEFSLKDVPKVDLLNQIDATIIAVETALDKLTSTELKAEYPLLVFKEKTSTEYFLVHLTTHLTYHLGQINYHRRLLE